MNLDPSASIPADWNPDPGWPPRAAPDEDLGPTPRPTPRHAAASGPPWRPQTADRRNPRPARADAPTALLGALDATPPSASPIGIIVEALAGPLLTQARKAVGGFGLATSRPGHAARRRALAEGLDGIILAPGREA